MYDISKRVKLEAATVEGLIAALKELPKDAKILCCGDSYGYIHVEYDGSVVNIDCEDLDEVYDEH